MAASGFFAASPGAIAPKENVGADFAAAAGCASAAGFAAVDGPAPNEKTTGAGPPAVGAVLAGAGCGAAVELVLNIGFDGDATGAAVFAAATAVVSAAGPDGESTPPAVGAAAAGAAVLAERLIRSVRCDAGLASIAVGDAAASAAAATPPLLWGVAARACSLF